MLKFTLSTEHYNTDDLVEALQHIVGLIEEGNTSGYHPHWTLDGKAELDPDYDMEPEHHHEDCDYRISSAAVETEKLHGVPKGETPTERRPCNLGCNQP